MVATLERLRYVLYNTRGEASGSGASAPEWIRFRWTSDETTNTTQACADTVMLVTGASYIGVWPLHDQTGNANHAGT